MTISGVTRGSSISPFDGSARASAPAGEAERQRRAQRGRDEQGDQRRAAGCSSSASRSDGSWPRRAGSPQYQRKGAALPAGAGTAVVERELHRDQDGTSDQAM